VYRLTRLLASRNTLSDHRPTGCGKEVVARAIHHLSPRASRAFAVVNLLPFRDMLEAELFGYAERLHGAMQSYAGRFRQRKAARFSRRIAKCL